MTVVKFDSNKDVISKHKPMFDRVANKIDEDTFILSGGRSSFKSYDISLAILIDIIIHASRNQIVNVVFFMNKAEDLKDGPFELIKSIIRDRGMDKEFRTREKPMRVIYKNGSTIHFYGLNKQDGKKGNALKNLIWKVYEECDQFASGEVIKTTDDTLLRNGIKGERIKTGIMFNPPKNKHHWIFEFIKNKKGMKIHTTYLDDDTEFGILNQQQLEEIEAIKITDYAWYTWNYLGIVPSNAEVDFPNPIAATEELELDEHDFIFAGIDAATKGKDSTELCLMSYNTKTNKIKLIGFQSFDDEWIDGYTSYKIGSDINAVLMSVNANAVYIDPKGGQHIIDYILTQDNGIVVGSIDFASSVSEKARGKTLLAINKRAEMYLNASEQLQNRNIVSYCDTSKLQKELDATEFITDARKIKVIDKKIIKSRIGRSPDSADGFVLCIQAIYDYMF